MSFDTSDMGFLALVSSFNRDALPPADLEDMQRGAAYIPNAVTIARRAGEAVRFTCIGPKDTWFWTMPDGKKIAHG